MQPLFHNRAEAGKVLAQKLSGYANRDDVLVLGLARGGVPVAFEVAEALDAPLDVFVVRKLGVPGQKELAAGAIASGGVRVINDEVIAAAGITDEEIAEVAAREMVELKRREQQYRHGRPAADARGKTVILVDDGLATGASMRAAAAALRTQRPARIVVAVPVASPQTCDEFRAEVDEIVCAATPQPFVAVGLWYEQFEQTSDQEVRELLDRAARRHPAAPVLRA